MLFYRIVSASSSHEYQSSLLVELGAHLKTVRNHFKRNKKGNDCQYQVQALNRLFRGDSIDDIPTQPASHAYMIDWHAGFIKLEEYESIAIAGTLYESGNAATDHEFSVVPFVNLTQINDPIQTETVIAEKTTLELYTIPATHFEEIPKFLHRKYTLDRLNNEFAFIEMGLWNQKQGHSVCYVYQKRDDQIDAFFCDPTQMIFSKDAGVFFSKYITKYPYFSKKLLHTGYQTQRSIKSEPNDSQGQLSKKRPRLGDSVSEIQMPIETQISVSSTRPQSTTVQRGNAPIENHLAASNTSEAVDTTTRHGVQRIGWAALNREVVFERLKAKIDPYLDVCKSWYDSHTTLISQAKIGILCRSKFQGFSVFFIPDKRSESITGRLELVASNGDRVQMDLMPATVGESRIYFLDGSTQISSAFYANQWRCSMMRSRSGVNPPFLSESDRLDADHSSAWFVKNINPSGLDTVDPAILTKINAVATLAHSFYEQAFQRDTIYPNEIQKKSLNDGGMIYYQLRDQPQVVDFEIVSDPDTCCLQFFLADTTRVQGAFYIPSQPPVDFFLQDWKLAGSFKIDRRPNRAHWLSKKFEVKESVIQKINKTIETCQIWHEQKSRQLRSGRNRSLADANIGQSYSETFGGMVLSFKYERISMGGIKGEVSVQLSSKESIELHFTPRSVFRDSIHYYYSPTNRIYKFHVSNGVVAENRLIRIR